MAAACEHLNPSPIGVKPETYLPGVSFKIDGGSFHNQTDTFHGPVDGLGFIEYDATDKFTVVKISGAPPSVLLGKNVLNILYNTP